MPDYYIPRTKKELVKWLEERHPSCRFGKVNKKQLYAIFFNTIRKVNYAR